MESNIPDAYKGWKKLVAHYQKPDVRKSIWQIINSFGGFFLGCILMYLSLKYVGYWLALLLSVPTAGFLVRVFIIQHDCGHGSFFKARAANNWVGTLCSLFTLTAYRYWQKGHAVHHAHHAELEERGIGDMWTLTVDEYFSAPWWKKTAYRIFRNPLFLFGLAPAINFIVLARFPLETQESWHNGERASVWWTNLMLVCWFSLLSVLIGFKALVVLGLPVIALAASAGTWLFYVQHQFERTYWDHTPEWDYTLAALEGSSYYKLPKLLQWFTGNIGFHHIHHLSPRIPNYNLQACHEQNPLFQRVTQLTLKTSFQTLTLALWDEQRRRLVTFKEAKKLRLA
jgi:omega-6 fatty acid desaturase (delta-12 desaturase)